MNQMINQSVSQEIQYISDFTNLQDYSVSIAINGCWFIPVCTVHNLTI